MEKYCRECGLELHGLKKMYCSRKCQDKYSQKHRTPEQRERYSKRSKETYLLKKEERLKQKAEYYQLNKEEIKKKNTAYKKANPETDKRYGNSIKGRYRVYKTGAKKRNLAFKLTLEDFEKMWDNNCHYCGDKIDGIGIDRVDNNTGYIKSNTVPCCSVCNLMKLTLRPNDFINQCVKIANKLNNY